MVAKYMMHNDEFNKRTKELELEYEEYHIKPSNYNKDIYKLLANIFEQPKIQTYIQSKIAKGKPMWSILSSMFQYILSRAGANPKVTTMVSTILSNLEYSELLSNPIVSASILSTPTAESTTAE